MTTRGSTIVEAAGTETGSRPAPERGKMLKTTRNAFRGGGGKRSHTRMNSCTTTDETDGGAPCRGPDLNLKTRRREGKKRQTQNRERPPAKETLTVKLKKDRITRSPSQGKQRPAGGADGHAKTREKVSLLARGVGKSAVAVTKVSPRGEKERETATRREGGKAEREGNLHEGKGQGGLGGGRAGKLSRKKNNNAVQELKEELGTASLTLKPRPTCVWGGGRANHPRNDPGGLFPQKRLNSREQFGDLTTRQKEKIASSKNLRFNERGQADTSTQVENAQSKTAQEFARRSTQVLSGLRGRPACCSRGGPELTKGN